MKSYVVVENTLSLGSRAMAGDASMAGIGAGGSEDDRFPVDQSWSKEVLS